MKIEVVGHKGVVGNATYQWLKAFGYQVVGRDKGDRIPIEADGLAASFICVPEAKVVDVCEEVEKYTDLIVIRSTITPDIISKLSYVLSYPGCNVHVCHLPEFLREATAVVDTFNQSFVLIGQCCDQHGQFLKRIYTSACVPIVVTDKQTSVMVKLTMNNYLACQISFWNEIEAIAQARGSHGHKIGAIASLDPRISSYGARFHGKYGGRCLPKDVEQLMRYAAEEDIPTPLLSAIKQVNDNA